MTIIVFGGSSGIGDAIMRELIGNKESDIINVDVVPSPIATQNLIGDISSVEFIDHVLYQLNSLKVIR